ncbi:class I SAM-dependent methyltransferase [Puerhibacterium sp. TATVAM-FAB25]|uniref:class I SAM-dependent methyltransferase n=1 Tax=Puerhibacterium sp. TATVAM-FAB25 TaxID=3093699 RepID=UPI00397DFF0B
MATRWRGVAAEFDVSFGRLCAGAVPHMVRGLPTVPAPTHVLDAGTGTGNLAGALSDAGHRVTAVDAEPTMVDRAATRRPEVTFLHAALPHLPFADRVFDAAVASFVLDHVDRPRHAVRELARVTRAGGTVRVSVWPAAPPSRLSRLWDEVVDRAGARRPPELAPPAGGLARDPRGMARLMAEAGLDDVTVSEASWTFRVPAEDLWVGVEAGLAAVGRTYLAQDLATRRAMRRAYEDLTAGRADGLLVLPATALLASGSVPERGPAAAGAAHCPDGGPGARDGR